MNPACLERAETGVYPLSSLKEVKKELMENYFEAKKGEKSYSVKSFLKKDIIWQQRDLISDQPDSDFHIIFLRNNLLTYYQDPEKTTTFKKAINRLISSGLLVIGSHEKLPFYTGQLKPIVPYSFVFKKIKQQ
jgi:chemotaxis methyl-accepting protein methylase